MFKFTYRLQATMGRREFASWLDDPKNRKFSRIYFEYKRNSWKIWLVLNRRPDLITMAAYMQKDEIWGYYVLPARALSNFLVQLKHQPAHTAYKALLDYIKARETTAYDQGDVLRAIGW